MAYTQLSGQLYTFGGYEVTDSYLGSLSAMSYDASGPGPTSTPVLATNTPTRTNTPVPPSNTPVPPSNTPVPPTDTPVPPSNTPVPPTPTSCTIQFTDVPPGSTFYAFIHCLACMGIVDGYPDGTFRPNLLVTRGQLAKIVANAAGYNNSVTGQTFEDVPPSQIFYIYIERLSSHGIINGYGCGGPGEPCDPQNRPYFRPGGAATRGQIMKVDVAAAVDVLGWPLLNPSTNTFEDVLVGSSFFRYIETAYAHSVVNGYACGGPGEPCIPPDNKPYFRPGAYVTRGQTAKIVSNTWFPGCNPPRR